jgi:hypothetical protein
MRRLLRPLWIALAVVFLLEAWVWDYGRVVVGAVVTRIPWRRLKEGAQAMIAPLPAGGTLAVFLIPVVLLFPLKICAVWLALKGMWVRAILVLVCAKLFGFGLSAFVFDVCRDKLFELSVCRRLYHGIVAARHQAHGRVDPLIRRLRQRFGSLERRGSTRLLRFIMRLRSKMRRGEPASRVAYPSFGNLRQRLSQAMVRSTLHRRGRTTKPFA